MVTNTANTFLFISVCSIRNKCNQMNLQLFFICSTPEDMQAKIPFISASQAKEICNFFKRKFNKDLT